MKIGEYNQMMAYLTRPEPLPQPKPEELLDLQEQRRKDRLRKTMEEIGPGLMDESVDFIERENFATKGIPGRGADYFTDRITDPTRLKFLDEAAKVYGYNNFSEVPITKQTVPGKRLTGVREKVLNYAKRRQEGIPIGKGSPGQPKKGGTDRSGLYTQEVIEKGIATKKKAYQESPVGKRLQWIADNGKNYDNPEEFIKAYEKHFKHKLGSEKDALFHFSPEDKLKSRYINAESKMVRIGSIDNLKNTGGVNDSFTFKQNFSEPEIFKASIIQNNPKVQKQFTNLFKEIYKDVSAYAELGPEGMIEKLKKYGSKLLKDFDFLEKYESRPGSQTYGGIHKGVTRESFRNLNIPDEHLKAFQSVRQPVLSLAKILERLKLRPKEISKQFNLSATTAKKLTEQLDNFLAGAGETKKIVANIDKTLGEKKFSSIFQGVNFEHTLAKQFGKDYNYLPRNYLLKGQFTTKAFNLFKRDVFDLPLIRLMKKFEAGEASADQVKNFIDDFNKKTNNYADFSFNTKKKKLEYTDNKVKYDLSRYANPGAAKQELIDNIKLTMSPEFQKGFKKNRFQDFEGVNKQLKLFRSKEAKEILKLVESIACPGKAMGGRIGFQDGTSCFEKGKKMINSGNIPEGAGKRNFIKFANKAAEIGKQSYRGLRTFAKFGIIPEAIFIGADTLIRAGMGDTFNEAFLRATDFYRTDDAYEQADKLEILRRMDPTNADLILNLRKFKSEQDKLSSLEQQKAADIALAGTDFDEFSIGETEEEIEKRYAPRIQEQENNLFNATISDAEERAGLKAETEFADKKGVAYKKNPVGQILDVAAEYPTIKPLVDYFATDVKGEPDVGTQALSNVFRDRGVSEQQIRAFEKGAEENPETARQLLDYFKSLDAKPLPEGMVRTDRSVADEERSILFELAKTDPALAERLFGPSMTFAGDPIEQTDLQDEMNLDRGIFALGGRIGFAEGPKDPGRRTFMKILAGLASIPILGKFLKPTAPAIKKLVNTSTKMPEWFPDFINKISFSGFGRKIDADLTLYETKELPGIQVFRNDDGRVFVEGTNDYGKSYKIEYEPPGYELLDEKTGKSVKKPGEFIAEEEVPVNVDPDGNADFDVEVLDDLDQILGSATRNMEEFATGKPVKEMKSGEFAVGKAEADLERAAEEAAELADEID